MQENRFHLCYNIVIKDKEIKMAKVVLKAGADPQQVAKRLKASGIIMTRKLADGSYVAYKKKPKERQLSTHEVHQLLNERAGEKIELRKFNILLARWYEIKDQPPARWMSATEAAKFLRYAW